MDCKSRIKRSTESNPHYHFPVEQLASFLGLSNRLCDCDQEKFHISQSWPQENCFRCYHAGSTAVVTALGNVTDFSIFCPGTLIVSPVIQNSQVSSAACSQQSHFQGQFPPLSLLPSRCQLNHPLEKTTVTLQPKEPLTSYFLRWYFISKEMGSWSQTNSSVNFLWECVFWSYFLQVIDYISTDFQMVQARVLFRNTTIIFVVYVVVATQALILQF